MTDPSERSGRRVRGGPPVLLGLAFGLVVGLGACAGPKPVLYPNSHYQTVGQATAERDIADCRRVADQAGAQRGSGQGEAAAGGAGAGGGVWGGGWGCRRGGP